MAGQRTTTTEQREQLNHEYAYTFSNAALGSVQYLPLFTAEIGTVIEKIIVRANANGGTTRTLQFAYAASGTAASSATNITSTVNVGTMTANTNYQTEAPTSAFNIAFMDDGATPAAIAFGGTKVPGYNLVPAGSTVYAVFQNTTVGSLDGLCITVRTTQKRH